MSLTVISRTRLTPSLLSSAILVSSVLLPSRLHLAQDAENEEEAAKNETHLAPANPGAREEGSEAGERRRLPEC